MDRKCPVCGFSSLDTAEWCDFCKEPFNRKPAVPAAAGPLPPPVIPAPPSPDAGKKPAEKKDTGTGIPPEFLRLDKGGDIPEPPSWLRYAAWGLLGALAIAMMTLMGVYCAKRAALEDGAAVQRRFDPSRR